MYAWLSSTPTLAHRRLILNPHRIRVPHKNSPGVLAAHLSNFAVCEEAGHPCDPRTDGSAHVQFVLMSTNTALFRPGLEEWVTRHSLSFCVSDTCADISPEYGPLSDLAHSWRRHLERIAWSEHPPSALF